MAKPIKFGDYSYPTKTACSKECEARIAKYTTGATLSADDEKFFRQLLTIHPDYEERLGSGIKSFKYDYSKSFGNKCLHIVRYDGSEESVSWKACLGKPKLEHQVESAFRREVKGDIYRLRERAILAGALCPISKREIVYGESYVIYGFKGQGLTFKQSVAWFLEQDKLTYEAVELEFPISNNDLRGKLVDESLAKRWREWHKKTSHITLVAYEEILLERENGEKNLFDRNREVEQRRARFTVL